MLTLELEAYAIFLKKFKNGDFGHQRLGQAFHNHFNMSKVESSRIELDRIYQLDGEAAKTAIRNLFMFN